MGVGRIGSRVAARLAPFELRRLGYDPPVGDEQLRAVGVGPVPLDRLLAEADFVTIHAVLTREDVWMIGEPELRRMKPTACSEAGIAAVTLERNALAAYDSWAKPFMQSKKWDEAIGVIEKGLARFPGNKHLQHNLKYCQQQRGK